MRALKRRFVNKRQRQSQHTAALAEAEYDGNVKRVLGIPRSVPAHLCIETNYEEVARWLAGLRKVVTESSFRTIARRARGRRPRKSNVFRYYDFAKINEITPPTALMIASEYDRMLDVAGGKVAVYNTRSWRLEVKVLLNDIGFFELLGIKLASPPKPRDQRFARMVTFRSGDTLQPQEISKLIDILVKNLVMADKTVLTDWERQEKMLKLVTALLEATENTRQHAYPRRMRDEVTCSPKWWMTGAVYPEQKRLTLIVYDQGLSIPGSLAEHSGSSWPGKAWVVATLSRLTGRGGSGAIDDHQNDHRKIRLAMNYGDTSTRSAHRGKGLPAIKDVVRHCRKGRLLVMSRHGRYEYIAGFRPHSQMLPVAVTGTLIVWDLWM